MLEYQTKPKLFFLQIMAEKLITFQYIQLNTAKPCLGRCRRRSNMHLHISKVRLSRLFKQDREGSLISIHFLTGVRFVNWSGTLKFMALVKIIWQRFSYYLGLRLPNRDVHTLSKTLLTVLNGGYSEYKIISTSLEYYFINCLNFCDKARWELFFFYCGLFVLIFVIFVLFLLFPSGLLQVILPRPRIGMLSLVIVSPVITAFHSCCLSHHVFDQVNLWPAWVGIETAIFWQCSPGTEEGQRWNLAET